MSVVDVIVVVDRAGRRQRTEQGAWEGDGSDYLRKSEQETVSLVREERPDGEARLVNVRERDGERKEVKV